MEFYDTIKDLVWDDVTRSVYEKTDADVRRALAKETPTIEDFKALVSPAAEPYLEQMAQLSRHYTQQRFGKVILLYIPMYLSNECSNHCIYCGFNHNNDIARKTLTDEEILEEIKVIKSMGYDNVLLLTGEHPRAAGADYIEHAIRLCRDHFAAINLEVYPMKVEEYRRMGQAGCNSVYIYQETYNESRYKIYHPKGMKSHYAWRLGTPERVAQAGIHRVGMGALIGLEEWRTEMVFLAMQGMRQMTIDGKACYVFFKPLGETGWSAAIVCLESDIFGAFYRMRRTVVFTVLAALLLMMMVCSRIIRRELKPLTQLSKQAETIASGNFGVVLPDDGRRDEIGQLTQSFTNMQHSLVSYIDELKQTTAQKASIESELKVARDIQMSMLPRVFPAFPNRRDIDLFAMMTPAKEVGGEQTMR